MVALVAEPTDEQAIRAMVDEAHRLREQMDEHRGAIADLAAQRKEIIRQLVAKVGRPEAGRRLGISTQSVTNILNG